jgi:hypothetical protein
MWKPVQEGWISSQWAHATNVTLIMVVPMLPPQVIIVVLVLVIVVIIIIIIICGLFNDTVSN